MITNYEEWISHLRDASLSHPPPVRQKDGQWEIGDRKQIWDTLAPRLFDQHLDRFLVVAVEVLREPNPELQLPADQRFAATVYGKGAKHSGALRKGIAESLAFLGTCPECFSSCSQGKPRGVAAMAVRRILKDADSVLWASLNDVLPMLAEAAPEEFLDGVEQALGSGGPFPKVFAEENSGVFGRTYMTGLLWGLEILAWSADHLQRVTVSLGELAAIDPGGNWVNRPSNSLTGVFLPWHPQTCAPLDKRKAAIEALSREQPDVGWKLLLNLLPNAHRSTSGTQKPKWRPFVPDDWSEGVTNREYWLQVKEYAAVAVDKALADSSRLLPLVQELSNLPEPAASRLLDYLKTQFRNQEPAARLPIWEELVKLIANHRKFHDAEWALSSDYLTKIEHVAGELAPKSPQLVHHRLFDLPDFELFEEIGNFEEQEKKVGAQRQAAVRDLLQELQLEGLLEFTRTVKEPGAVGQALGYIELDQLDSELLPAIFERKDDALLLFIGGYIWTKFANNGWQWVEKVLLGGWTIPQKLSFLLNLPFQYETWSRAEEVLGNNASEYWANVNVRPYGNQQHLDQVVERLLTHGRPRAALGCLYRMLNEKKSFPHTLATRALLDAVNSSECYYALDHHQSTELIKWLQDSKVADESTMVRIEWAYLPLLDHRHGAAPKTLERHLTTEPSFFSEVLARVFRSDNENPGEEGEVDERRKAIAENAYRLLHGWTIPPGAREDGAFDASDFEKWLTEVKKLTRESGHFDIAMDQVGKVLAYSPSDPDGLWIHRAIAETLNEKEAKAMRDGFVTEHLNMRGVHGYSGGKEERQLAEQYRQRAGAVEDKSFSRLATAIREISRHYESEAEFDEKRHPFDH